MEKSRLDAAGFAGRGARGCVSLRCVNTSERARRYSIAIHRASGCYFAAVTGLPGCLSRGATQVEALENARAAIRAFLIVETVLALQEPAVRLEINA